MVNTRHVEVQGKEVQQLLTQWQGLLSLDANWEDSGHIKAQFPEFYHLCDKNRFKGLTLSHMGKGIKVKEVKVFFCYFKQRLPQLFTFTVVDILNSLKVE